MDLYDDYQNRQPASHYERVDLNNDRLELIQLVKYNAFNLMDHLEGWCTKSKASILIDLIFLTNPKKVVEIGVWGGKSLIPMAFALSIIQTGKVYGIDPWSNAASVEGMEGMNYDWWSKVDHSMILRGLQGKISDYNLTKQIELIQLTSEAAPPIYSIDILHIDGNHSEEASMLDVCKWVPLVNKGGFIIFDDITWGTNAKAVEWLDQHCIKIAEFHEYNDWGIWVKP